MAVKTGILTFTERHSNVILEHVYDKEYILRSVYSTLKSSLSGEIGKRVWEDNRAFFIRTSPVDREVQEFDTIWTISALVLLHDYREAEVGESGITTKEQWQAHQTRYGKYFYVRKLAELKVQDLAPDDLPIFSSLIEEMCFKAVRFSVNHEIVHAWERVS